MINIRPGKNPSMTIANPEVRRKVDGIVRRLLGGEE